MVAWLVLAALVLLAAVVTVRTLRFTPPAEPKVAPIHDELDEAAIASHLSQLVQCPTVSHPDASEEDADAFVRLEALLPTLFPTVFAVCEHETVGSKGHILHWKGTDKNAEPLILTAHYDVVPADASKWQKPPFSGEIADGIIYGRGTLDTKCTLSAALDAAESLMKEGFTPSRDIYFCFAGDEEVIGIGASAIVDVLEKRGIRPMMVLDEGGAIVEKVFPGVSVPCALIGVAEKGSANYRLTVYHDGGHSSAPPAKSAVDRLCRACVELHDKPFRFRVTPPAQMLLNCLARHSTGLFRMIFANLWLFSPVLNLICRKSGGELNALMRTTLAFTMLKGSEQANVLPGEASMTLNARILPGETRQSVLEGMKARMSDKKVEIELLRGSEPSACSPADGEGYEALQTAIRETYPGVLVSPYMMIACSDARHYERICGHVYRFSGMPLSSAERKMIHGIDERIPVAKQADTVRFYRRVISHVAAGK